MRVTVTYQGTSYDGDCKLGDTLLEFFRSQGVSVSETLQVAGGRLVVPEFALAHHWNGADLQAAQTAEAKPALRAEDLSVSGNLNSAR